MEKPTDDINFVPGLMSKGVTVIANKRGKNMSASDCQQMARENDEAIAWTHRKDYAKGGFVMLSNADSTGQKVAIQSLVFCLALLVGVLMKS